MHNKNSLMEASEKQTAARKGRISEELQQQAKKAESPVISEFLVAARKGFTQHVLQTLTEGGSAKAAVVDKVYLLTRIIASLCCKH